MKSNNDRPRAAKKSGSSSSSRSSSSSSSRSSSSSSSRTSWSGSTRSASSSRPRRTDTDAGSAPYEKSSVFANARTAGGAKSGFRQGPAAEQKEMSAYARAVTHALLGNGISTVANRAEPFADLPYEQELSVKSREFARWWKDARFGGELMSFAAAPQPRAYRATTKRMVRYRGDTLIVGFADQAFGYNASREPFYVSRSAIEPQSHFEIYSFLAEKLSARSYRVLAEALNFIIIRDTGERAVIFNVSELSGDIVRKTKALGEQLQKSDFGLSSAWVFHDASRSEYYLDQKEPEPGSLRLKKLFGYDALQLTVNDIRFRVSPFAFSQVNIPMMKEMVHTVEQQLPPGNAQRLLDLYCGYGLFSHVLSAHFSESIGLDSAADSIAGAADLVSKRKKAGHTLGSMHFRKCFITPQSLDQHLPPAGKISEVIILDPPRQGTSPAIIESLAERNADLVIHIFCAIEEIQPALKEWKKHGYQPHRVRAMDMFPGTPAIETMVVLTKPE